MKQYKIKDRLFTLREYGDYELGEEDIIEQNLKAGAGQIDLNPGKIMPLMLIPDDGGDPVNPKDIKHNMILDIIIDYMESKESFFLNIPKRLESSRKKKSELN